MSRTSASGEALFLDEPRLQQSAEPAAAATPVSNPPASLLPLVLLGSVLFWIIAWHGDAAARMVGIWWRSDTFAHGLIVYPVSVWLAWRRRAALAQLSIAPFYWGFIPLLVLAFAALLGDVGGVEAARQFGLVAMLALAVVVILGAQVGRTLAFPLAFTLMAVPIGEFLMPIMMQHTADFTIAALRLSGIPVYREGLYFTLPTGRWSVVEACSGLRYLIASVVLGLLYAYVSYRTLWRRLAFVAAAIAVPIVANWLRAYIIVMIGHLSGMRYAVGADHLVYGWVFFGIVMLILFWVGSWWREEPQPEPARIGPAPRGGRAATLPAGLVIAALGVAAVASAGPLYVHFLEAMAGPSARVLEPLEPAGGWERAATKPVGFRPHFLNARDSLHETFQRQGRTVTVFLGYYADQHDGAELIGFGNTLVTSRDRTWSRLDTRHLTRQEPRPPAIESRLRSPHGELLAWHWYWAGGRWSVRPEEVKLRQALDRLLGKGDEAAVVVLYTPIAELRREEAAALLQEFLVEMEPRIREALEATRSKGARPTATLETIRAGF